MLARVTEVHRTNYIVEYAGDSKTAVVRGSFHLEGDFPVVGDYVEIEVIDTDNCVITGIATRQSVIKRKSSDEEEEQVLVANVDLLVVVMALDNDFNLSRLERYLLLAETSNIKPIIILNKSDVARDYQTQVADVLKLAGETDLVTVSAKTGENMGALYEYFKPGTTAVLLGSSGAGKSTITNYLLEDAVQIVQETRSDDGRGRHTTTSRQLFSLSNGAYIIDTPGMRELGVTEVTRSDAVAVFEKIQAIATHCRFRNCDHEQSQGCAVLEALEQNEISAREVANFQKLMREQIYNETRESGHKQRYQEQVLKRQRQYQEAKRRKRLSGGA